METVKIQKDNNEMSSIKKNLLYVYSVNLINGFAGIAFIPIALKSLGAEGYGIYSIFIILSSYIYFIEMGVAKYFTRTIAQTNIEQEQEKNVRTAVSIYIRITFILMGITPILVYVVPNFIFPTDNHNLVGVMVILAAIDYLLSIPTTIQVTYTTGKENFYKISKFNLFSGLSKNLSLILAVIFIKSVIFVILVMLLRRIVDIYYARKYLEKLPGKSWKPLYKKGEFKKIISQSIFLSAAQLTQITIISIGTYLVNKNFSIEELGIYKSTFDLATKIWFFSNSLGLVIFPRFSSLLTKEQGKDLLLPKLMVINNLSWILYNFFFLSVFYILPNLPNVLLIKNMDLFFLLLYGACLNAHTNLSYEFLQADSKLRQVIVTSLLALVLIYITFHMTIETYGLTAIGISWVVSQLIYSFVMDILAIKEIKRSKFILSLLLNVFVVLIIGVLILM
ncbi:hypothetical protein JFL43_20285 [Viridibacillus sp. YIM B01967]|uniref:Polysaccharide biosynthesis protein n=1 Tax=Viridibacillus soli TaxID=2798301 RepID=A0ABS1HDH1_9BACL|nr:oligosaccharide flippase family protein [Viridibacillus soli]MBK3497127.1 hypothetical protein [Viridibacillus soli]